MCFVDKPESGMIVFFDSRKDKQFGFIKPDTGDPDVWFHANDGREPTQKGEDVVFEKVIQGDPPRMGNRVVFFRATGSGGRPKACPWAHEDVYTNARIWADYDAFLRRARAQEEETERAVQAHEELKEKEAQEIVAAEARRSELSWQDRSDPRDPGKMTDESGSDESDVEEDEDSCFVCLGDPCECEDGVEWWVEEDDEEFEDNTEPPDPEAEFLSLDDMEGPEDETSLPPGW